MTSLAKLTRLKVIRERMPMTQEELATAAGVNRVTIAKIEAGNVDPYPSTVRKLAAALRVEPRELMQPEAAEEK